MPFELHGKALALATGTTYDAVVTSGVTAHPVKRPYPKGNGGFVIPIAKGGRIEWVFEVMRILEMKPLDMVSFASQEGEALGSALLSYHAARIEAYGGAIGKAYQLEVPYRFYVMRKAAIILSPTHRKHIQVSTLMDLDEMSLRPIPKAYEESEIGLDGKQIRIIPMDASAIHGQSCQEFFTETIPNRGGKYYYGRNSVKSPAGSLLLFQMNSHLVASARLAGKIKGPLTDEHGETQGGYYILDSESIALPAAPITLDEFIKLVPPFEGKAFSNAMHHIPVEYENAIVSAFTPIAQIQHDHSQALELTTVVESIEGGTKLYYTTKYERDSKNRARAIQIHGVKCQACGFDFEAVYGQLGKDFIEVHHRKPLYSLDGETAINPETDLVCICSNCHRMVHRKKDRVLEIEELRDLIEEQRRAHPSLRKDHR